VVSGYRNAVAAYQRNPAIGSLRLAFIVAILIEGLAEAPFRMMTPTWFLLLWATIDSPIAGDISSLRERHKRSLPAKAWFGTPANKKAVYANSSLIRDSANSRSGFNEIDETELPELSRR